MLLCDAPPPPLSSSTLAARPLSLALSWHAGTDYRRLEALVPDINDPCSERLWLAFDWLQLYKGKSYSTGVVVIASERMPDDMSARDGCVEIVAIIPGPTAPRNFSSCLIRTLARMAASTGHLPGPGEAPGTRHPIILRTHQEDPAGGMRVATVKQAVYLTGIMADTPARAKLMLTMGPGARLPCSWCLCEAQPVKGNTGRNVTYYPMGYAEKQPQTLRHVHGSTHFPTHPGCCAADAWQA